MNPLFRSGVIVLILLFTWISSAHALLFERHKTFDSEISWFVYPVVGTIPGVQDFMDLAALFQGLAEVSLISLLSVSEGKQNILMMIFR